MKRNRKLLLGSLFLVLALSLVYFVPERQVAAKTKHFTLRFSRSVDNEAIMALATTLERNYQRVGNDLETAPAPTIEVTIYARRWRYVKATGNWSASGNIEGTSKIHFVEQAWGEDDNKKVSVHEFAHTVTLKLLLDNEAQPVDPGGFDKKFSSFPTWLWEAIAVYEANQFVDPRTWTFFGGGKYPAIPELNKRMKGGKIYSCGYTIIQYILSEYGQDGFIRLIKNYGDLQKTFQVTDDQFCKGWYEFVTKKYLL